MVDGPDYLARMRQTQTAVVVLCVFWMTFAITYATADVPLWMASVFSVNNAGVALIFFPLLATGDDNPRPRITMMVTFTILVVVGAAIYRSLG